MMEYKGYVKQEDIYDIKRKGLELKDYNMFLEARKRDAITFFILYVLLFLFMFAFGFLVGGSFVATELGLLWKN